LNINDEENDDEQLSLQLYQKLVLDHIINNNTDTSTRRYDNMDKTKDESSSFSLSKNNALGHVDIMNLPKEWTSNVIQMNSRKKTHNNNYKNRRACRNDNTQQKNISNCRF